MALNRLDLPTPVEPKITTNRGAERSDALGIKYSATCLRSVSARSTRPASGAVSARRPRAAARSDSS